MTIELDTTLAQAEVLFLSFAQLVADIDCRRAEEASRGTDELRRRNINKSDSTPQIKSTIPLVTDDLRDLLKAGR